MKRNRRLSIWPLAGLAALLLPAAAGMRSSSPPQDANASASGLVRETRGISGHSLAHAIVNLREIAARAEAGAPPETEGERIEEPQRAPKPPLPSGAPLRLDSPRPRQAAREMPRLASPPLASSFPALGDNGRFFPPDTVGAVGPNHVVTTLNSQVRVQDRAGREILTIDLTSFWFPLPGHLSVFDPRIFYEPFLDRWIAAAAAAANSADSSVLIGVSNSGDPTGAWNLYRIGVDSEGKVWADYPTLGFNKNWIAVQVNAIDVGSPTPRFRQTQIYAFDKTALVAGAPDARYTLFTRTDLGSTQVPAATLDPLEDSLYALEDWNGNNGGLGALALFSISGPVGSEVLRLISFPATSQTWDDYAPNLDFAPQKESTTRLAANDANFAQVIFQNGLITSAHTIFLPAGGAATHSALQYWQLTPDGDIVQRGRLEDPAARNFYAFPSIAPNRNNDLLVGFAAFSADQFASAGYAFRAAGDPEGTLRDPAVLKNGEAFWTRIRWGDYSATMRDPVNGLDFWTIQEYAGPLVTGLSRWATWWGRVVPDSGDAVPLPTAGFAAPPTSIAGNPVSFTDGSIGATRWFWNFGDGTTSAERSPTHVFKLSGTRTVTQTAVNQTGATAARRTINVAPPPKSAPVPASGRPPAARAVTPRR